jgi:hypothetical protein
MLNASLIHFRVQEETSRTRMDVRARWLKEMFG